MSLKLDHGPRPLKASHMYPVFYPSPRFRHNSPLQPDTEVPPLEDIVRATPSSQPEALRPYTSGTAAQLHGHSNGDVDSNQYRRKHRGVAPNTDPAPVRGLGPMLRQGTKGAPNQDPTEEGHEGSFTDERDCSQAPSPVNVKGSPTSKSPLSSSASCLPAQLSSSHSRQLTINLSPSKSRSVPNSSDSHLRSTLKSKMLCLSSDGKLAKSRVGVTSDSNTKQRSESSQNLRLKNGRIVPSHRVTLCYVQDAARGDLSVGERINRILSSPRHAVQLSDHKDNQSHPSKVGSQPVKATHPFFLRKAPISGQVDKESKDGESTTDKGSGYEPTARIQKPKAWAAIKFSSSKINPSRDVSTIQAPWPPIHSQYHGHPLPQTAVTLSADLYARAAKQKHERICVPNNEDVLYRFRDALCQVSLEEAGSITAPQPRSIMPKELLTVVQSHQNECFQWSVTPSALQSRKRQLLHSRSSFDRGLPAGPHNWTQKHAPTKTEEVLQPSVRELAAWLTQMKVHNVQSGLPVAEDRPRKVRRKAQAKKKQDDLDDFIVSSDELMPDVDAPKNAILICGPHGCGKTASVYAVASELDFEVFELHPGMRRSAKDIFDRVGDMTANHLVQHSAPPRRPRGTAATEIDSSGEPPKEITGCRQPNMTSFVTGPKKRKSQQIQSKPHNPVQERGTSNQKQSVILLEEVDILFDDDKSFWPGVQALIQQSKRPIVMTCNSLESLPVEELPLHAILNYERQPIGDAVEYLAHVAAMEGHLLDRFALTTLYQSRGRDLRGALMDLDFWCQMTVGSKVGGLDWIPTDCHNVSATRHPRPRVISHGTFRGGLNLIPATPSTNEELLAFVQDQLGVPFLDLEAARTHNPSTDDAVPLLAQLDEACAVSDTRSCADIADSHLGALLTTAASNAFYVDDGTSPTEVVVSLICDRISSLDPLSRRGVALRLHPIMDDLQIFPTAVGRTSPSIDGAGCAVVTEVAPYVRSIVAFDQQLQQRRIELNGGSQGGKQRTTRAARAAQEGGDKSNTRRERWFLKELDYDAVLQTRPRFAKEDAQF